MISIAIVRDPRNDMNKNYCAAVEAAGAKAIMLEWDSAPEIIQSVDGIVIPGGVDINPAVYGEKNTASVDIDDRLDRFEMFVIGTALRNKKPILGICRGHQLLNVYFGGTLNQNVDHCEIHMREAHQKDRVHGSTVAKNSFLHQVYGGEELMINSAHHQAIALLSEDFRPVQYSLDGEIEAIEHKTMPIYGVQWHPERTCLAYESPNVANGLKLFEYFVAKCGRRI